MTIAGMPDNLPDAQAMIVRLMDEAEKADKLQNETFQTLQKGAAMIDAARKALNAVEAPAKIEPKGDAQS